MYKRIIYIYFTRIGRAITTWNEVFFKLGVSFDVLVIRKEVLLDFILRIETYPDVVVEFIELQRSVTF